MGVEEVKGLDRFREIIGRDEYSVFDFWAEWCGPCRIMAPIYEKLASEHGQHVKFYKVDNDAEEDIVNELDIRGLPSFLLFKKGEQVGSVLGANPPLLQQLIAKAAEDAAAAGGKPADAAPAAPAGAPTGEP